MKELNLHGGAWDIGRQHGELGRKEVKNSLEVYERLFYGYQKINWDIVKERAKLHLPVIEKFDMKLIEEMQGIASGAGVDFEDILALNARTEIALTGDSHTYFSDGCTTIGTTTPVTSNTIIGQNWDWKGDQKDSLLLLNIEREDRPNILMVTEAGIIGKIGCNENSVGVCLNALTTTSKANGLPIHLALRSILDSTSLHEAMDNLQSTQLGSTANFLIGYSDQTDRGVVLQTEVSPFGMSIINDDVGYGVHANHICSREILMHTEEKNELRFSDSIIRQRRAEQLIQKAQKEQIKIDENVYKSWFSDTFNSPRSINRYINHKAPEHLQSETVFSIIMNLTTKEIYLCDGMPIDTPYKKYSIVGT